MPIGVGDIKKGMAIEIDGTPYIIAEYESSKMQQRAPVTRIKLRELKTGRLVEKSFTGYNVKFNEAAIEQRTAQYLYNDDNLYYFMDTENYEQFPMTADQLGDVLNYLIDQMQVDVVFYNSSPESIELPNSVDLKVLEAPPGLKGDTAQGGTKPVTLETGLIVNVPLFINEGDTLKIDTRSGEYLSRQTLS